MKFSNEYLRLCLITLEKLIFNSPVLPGNMRNNDYIKAIAMGNMLTQDSGFIYKQLIPTATDEDIKMLRVRQMLLQSVIIMDFYILVNKNIVLDVATKEEIRILNQIKSAHKKGNDFSALIRNPNNITELLDASHIMNNLSFYDKALAYLLLDEEDMEIISSFNSFFMADYLEHSEKISPNFIIKQIFRSINKTNDRIASIEEAAEFLVNAFYGDVEGIEETVVDIINFTESEDIMQALVDENISSVAVHLFNYYDKKTNDGPKLK